MDNDTIWGFVGTLAITATLCALGGCIHGATTTNDRIKQEAIVAGVAEYYLDAEYERQFRWKTEHFCITCGARNLVQE